MFNHYFVFFFYFSEIKIHPGLSATDTDQVNIIGGEYTNMYIQFMYCTFRYYLWLLRHC